MIDVTIFHILQLTMVNSREVGSTAGSQVLCALVLLCVVGTARAHGYMKMPAARNVLANSDYCPHCLAAGGPRVVGDGLTFPEGRNGICGDPYTDPMPRNHEAGGKYWTGTPAAVYLEGQTMEIDITVTTNHNGRFQFRICKIDGVSKKAERKQLTEECLDEHVLVQADVPGAQQPGEQYFYTTPGDPMYYEYKMYYQLPEGLTCDGEDSKCVIQWYWVTGNTCTPEGTPAQYTRPSGIPQCGTVSSNYPEEFWNCADILIVDRGRGFVSTSEYGPAQPQDGTVTLQRVTAADEEPAIKVEYPHSYANYQCAEIETEYGLVPDTLRGCKGYFMCSEIGSWYFFCPEGQLFDKVQRKCDFAVNVQCEADNVQIQSDIGPFWVI